MSTQAPRDNDVVFSQPKPVSTQRVVNVARAERARSVSCDRGNVNTGAAKQRGRPKLQANRNRDRSASVKSAKHAQTKSSVNEPINSGNVPHTSPATTGNYNK